MKWNFCLVFQNSTVNDGMETFFFTHSGLQTFAEENALSVGGRKTRKT